MLLFHLQQKIRVMWPSANEAYRFFDIKSNNKVTKEHFVFCCNFLHLNHQFEDVVELFNVLDANQDGSIDENEFERIFMGVIGTWNSHEFEIIKSVLREGEKCSNIDIDKAYNTLQKDAQPDAHLKDLPYFSS